MNVLVICHEHPPLGGGGGNAARHLARSLAARYNDRVVFVTSGFRSLPSEETVDGYTIRRIDIGRKSSSGSSAAEWARFGFAAVRELRALIDGGFRPDACVAFFSLPAGYVAWRLKKSYNIPYIVSLRGADVPGFLDSQLAFFHRLLKPITRRIWRNAATVAANCTALENLAHAAVPDVRSTVIINGFDPETFSPAAAAPAAGPVRLLFLGRLEYQKGLDVLLSALENTGADIVLTVAGDGSLRPVLERRAAHGPLKNKVFFAGWQERSRLPELYRATDIFVLPSFDEGMPQAVMEAMASGLPVIATRAGGTPDLVTDGVTGLLVEPGNAAMLACAVARLAESPELRRSLGAAGRAASLSHTWNDVAAEYHTIIERKQS